MNAFLLFLICVGFGFCLGVLYSALYLFKVLLKNNYVLCNIINFVFAIGYGFLILITMVNFNYGEFRLFLLLGFVIGTILERKTLNKIFAKIINWLYNKLSKAIKSLQKTKFYKKVTKWTRKKLLS